MRVVILCGYLFYSQFSHFNGTVLRLSPTYIETYGEPIYFPDLAQLQPGDVLLARDDATPETCEAVADLRTAFACCFGILAKRAQTRLTLARTHCQAARRFGRTVT